MTKKKVGRPAKAPEDRATESVPVMLSPRQLEKLKSKAGEVPLSRYIKKVLNDNGDI
jgi:hypothetical protein